MTVRPEDAGKMCCFMSMAAPTTRSCQGKDCMAWGVQWERQNLPAGSEAPVGGGGWIKDGPPRLVGGEPAHRQSWKREVGRCGAAGR